MTENPKFKIIAHNTPEYWDLVDLRTLVLRKPLNLVFSIDELIKEHNQHHFGVWIDNQPVATLILAETDTDTIKMRQVCTHPDYQGRGIGKALASFAEKWGKENGYSKINCHARATAVPFYKSMGYQIVSEMFYEVGLEHYKMEKNL